MGSSLFLVPLCFLQRPCSPFGCRPLPLSHLCNPSQQTSCSGRCCGQSATVAREDLRSLVIRCFPASLEPDDRCLVVSLQLDQVVHVTASLLKGSDHPSQQLAVTLQPSHQRTLLTLFNSVISCIQSSQRPPVLSHYKARSSLDSFFLLWPLFRSLDSKTRLRRLLSVPQVLPQHYPRLQVQLQDQESPA